MSNMTVKELIEELTRLVDDGKVNPDEPLTLQKDPEGNGYYPIRGAEPARRDPTDGEVYIRELTDELQEQGFGEEDVGPEDCENCVVIFP